MARSRRTHRNKKSDIRSRRRRKANWAVMGAVVASATFGRITTPLYADDLKRSLERLRVVVPGEVLGRPVLAAQAPASQGSTAVRFDIPAGPLVAALNAYEQATGIKVTLATDSVRGLTSPGVTGLLIPERALDELLRGTSLTARFTTPRAATIEIRINSESVDVSAGVPVPTPSSPKYTQPIIDTPQTIAVIPREVMEAQGVTTLSDALRNVPGISLQAGEGGGASNTSGDMFNMRGFSANNSLFVDGVRDDGLMSRDVYNLEQVEVFMGPTGSDVGRGNAAGYVNMETKAPHLPAAYGAAYGFGSADQRRLTVDLNQPLTLGAAGSWLNHSAIRLNGLWQDGGAVGRDVVENKSQSVAPSVAFGLSTPTRVSAGAQVTRQDNLPDYGIPGSAWPDVQLAPTTVIASRPVEQSNYYGSLGYDYDEVSQESYTGRVEHDVNRNITLRNQVRYNHTHRTAVISTVQSPTSFASDTELVTVARQGNERENRILSNQSSMVSRFAGAGLNHVVSAGLEFAGEEQFAPTLTGLGVRNPVSIYNPNPNDPVTGYAVARNGAYNKGRTNTVGLYAFDTIELGAKWQVSGGLRVEHYNAKYRVVDATGTATTDLAVGDNLVSGKAGLLYKMTDQGNVYFSYGSTVTPPGTANFTLSAQSNNQNNPNVKPQESKNYEVGSKFGLFGNRLSLSAALFRTDNKNVIFTVDATAVPPIYNQDDGQRVNGMTFGSLGQLTEHWQVLANFAYLDTRQVSQNPVNNGRDLTLTPALSGSLWTTYQFPKGLMVGGGVRSMDHVFVNAASTIRVPGYNVADAMAQYPVNSHLTLRLNVNNLTDQVYIKNVNNNGGRYNPGAPRSATLTSTIQF